MTYQEAKQQAFKVRWKVGKCFSGDECWCKPIQGEEPIMFMDGDREQEHYIVDSGTVRKEIAEYIVELHNKNIESRQ